MKSYREPRQNYSDAFPLYIYRCNRKNAGKCVAPPHYHSDIEIMQPLEGITQLIVGSETVEAEPGKIYLVNPGEIHALYTQSQPTSYRCFIFRRELLDLPDESPVMTRLILPLFGGKLHLPLCCAEQKYHDLLNEVSDLYGQPGGEALIVAALLRFCALLERDGLLSPAEPDPRINDPLHLAIDFMEEHYTERITLPQIAEKAGMNPQYFCRFFKKQTLSTPITYLNALRIRRAKELLRRTDLSVLEVAMQSGFENVSFFIKRFKAATGKTPLAYRKGK